MEENNEQQAVKTSKKFTKKNIIVLAVISCIVIAGIAVGATFGIKAALAKNKEQNQAAQPLEQVANMGNATENPSEPISNPSTPEADPSDPVVNPGAEPVDPAVEPEPEEQKTEAEYKLMCEEKFEDLLFARSNNNYSNIEYKAIDTLNGKVYLTATTGRGDNTMVTFTFDNSQTNVPTYAELYKNIADYSVDNILNLSLSENIEPQVTPESYQTFLDGVASDEGFRTVMTDNGITLPTGEYHLEDICATLNVKVYDNKDLYLTLVGINGKTCEVLIFYSALPIEATSAQRKIDAVNTGLAASFMFVKQSDFETIEDSQE